MEVGKELSVSAFDWDDTALIEAYDRVMKSSKKNSKSKGRNKNKENSKDNTATKPWAIGDYCQAIYNEDGLLYEAVILAVEGNYCQVEFLGYGDIQETETDGLLESNGSKARAKQRKSASKADSSLSGTDTDYSGASRNRNANRRHKQVPHQSHDYHNFATPENHKQSQPYVAHQVTHSTLPPTTHIQRIAETASNSFLPSPPPIPSCSAVSQDPALSAMLMSWYMAGYYTGLHQNQKSSHCVVPHKPRCCDHRGVSNHCDSCY